MISDSERLMVDLAALSTAMREKLDVTKLQQAEEISSKLLTIKILEDKVTIQTIIIFQPKCLIVFCFLFLIKIICSNRNRLELP